MRQPYQGRQQDRTLVETVAYVRPPQDLPAVIAEVREAEMYPATAAWFRANGPFRRDILAPLEKNGPLRSRDIPDTSVEPWPWSGWTNNRNVTKMLEVLALRGHIAISGRKGRQRYWGLTERVYPADRPSGTGRAALCRRRRRGSGRRGYAGHVASPWAPWRGRWRSRPAASPASSTGWSPRSTPNGSPAPPTAGSSTPL